MHGSISPCKVIPTLPRCNTKPTPALHFSERIVPTLRISSIYGFSLIRFADGFCRLTLVKESCQLFHRIEDAVRDAYHDEAGSIGIGSAVVDFVRLIYLFFTPKLKRRG